MRTWVWVRSLLVLVATIGLSGGTVVGAGAAPLTTANSLAAAAQCTDAHLRVRVHFDGQASGAGQRLAYVDFQNTGTATCALHGAPGVSLVGHGNGTQLGRPANHHQTGAAPVVRLAHGQSARSDLQFINVDQGGGAYDTSCHVAKADGYRIYAPHSYRAVYVHSPQYACTNTKIHWGSIGYVDAKPIGCAATTSGIPAGATRKKIADVDGDWNADTEWMTATRFGITTASGATTTVTPSVTGGADPRALSFVSTNSSTALTVIAGSRDAQLLRFADSSCTLRAVLNKQGHPYRFDLTGKYGNGVACVDPDRNGVDQIAGTHLSTPLGSLRNGDTETVSTTTISINGLHASNGSTRSSTYTWPTDQKQIKAAASITCRTSTIDHDGITAHHR